jgi:hypothetical protein
VKILFLPQAEEELLSLRDPLFSKIIHRIELLPSYPSLGAAMTGPFAQYRSLVVEFHRVYYRLSPTGHIIVTHLRDCRRKPVL